MGSVAADRAFADPEGPGSPESLDVSTEAGAMAEARRTGTPVEVTSLATPTQTVMADPVSGTFAATISALPTRVETASGWKSIDRRMARSASGGVAPTQPDFGLVVSSGGAGPLVTVSDAGREFRLSWPEALPEPELVDDMAIYRSVLPEVDLVVRTGVTAVNIYLVVWSRVAAQNPAVRSIPFTWSGDGLSVVVNSSGGFDLVDDAGEPVFGTPGFAMWSTPGVGSSAEAVALGDPDGTVQVGMEISGSQIVLTPSAAMLDAPETVFPVVIDPSVTVKSRLYWVMVWSNGQNFYNSTTQVPRVGYDGWDTTYGFKKSRSFYRMAWGISGKIIIEATFRHKLVYSPNNDCQLSTFGPGVQVWLSAVVSSSTTWSNQPELKQLQSTNTMAVGSKSTCSDAVSEWDVTKAAKSANTGGWSNVTFAMVSADESDKNGWRKYTTSTSYPTLEVVYNTVPNKATNLGLVGDNIVSACGKVWSKTKTPTLSAKVSDPDGDKVYARFYLQGQSGALTSAGSTTQPSVQTVTVPTSRALSEGAQSFQASGWDGSAESAKTSFAFTVDTTPPPPPAITVIAPDVNFRDDDPTANRQFVVRFTRTSADQNGVRVGWNGATPSQWKLFDSSGVIEYTVSMPSTPSYKINYRAEDCAGHPSSTPSTIVRSVDPTRPEHVYTFDNAASVGADTPLAGVAAILLSGGAAATSGGVTSGINGGSTTDLALASPPGSGPVLTGSAPVNTAGSFTMSARTLLNPSVATSVGASGTLAELSSGSSSVSRLSWRVDSTGTREWVFTLTIGGAVQEVSGGVAEADTGLELWGHVVGTYDRRARVMRLFVNGAEVATKTNLPSGAIPSTATSIAVGSGFDGRIDRLKFMPTYVVTGAVLTVLKEA